MGLDKGLCFLWSLLSMEEVGMNDTCNRLRKAILKVRSRIVHALEQKKIDEDAPRALSRRMEVGNSEHMVMRRDFFRALEEKKLTRDEYAQAISIIGKTPAEFNVQELASKIAVTEMASGFGRGRSLE